jgi:hypothetical protein
VLAKLWATTFNKWVIYISLKTILSWKNLIFPLLTPFAMGKNLLEPLVHLISSSPPTASLILLTLIIKIFHLLLLSCFFPHTLLMAIWHPLNLDIILLVGNLFFLIMQLGSTLIINME